MHTEDYIGEKTGLLLVDPYNDFLSPAGKLWPQAKEVAEEVNLLSNLKSIVDVARRSGIRIFFVPHHTLSCANAFTSVKLATTPTKVPTMRAAPFANMLPVWRSPPTI